MAIDSARDLVRLIGPALRSRGATLATAESCTGGLLGALLTDEPGSSEYFVGGIVAYHDDVKVSLLGVAPSTLAQSGAVSDATAREMAEGARGELAADYAVSITGIAGPGGGTPEKPVGLVYLGLATVRGTHTKHYVFEGDRAAVRRSASAAALRMVLDSIEEANRDQHGEAGSGVR